MAATFRVATLETAFTADTSQVDAAVKKVKGETTSLTKAPVELEVGADTAQADRKLKDVKDLLESVGRTDVDPQIVADTLDAMADLDRLADELEDVNSTRTKADIEADADDALDRAAELYDKLQEIDDVEVEPKVDPSGVDDGLRKASDGLDDFKGEVADTGREAAASFSGEFEDVGDFMQEAIVNGLAALGGPVGMAAGLAGGVIGGVLLSSYMEQTEKLKDLTADIFSAIAEDGAASFETMSAAARRAFLETQTEALLAEHGFEKFKDAAEALGVSTEDVLSAMAGDTEALTTVSEAYNDKVGEISEQWGAGGDAAAGQIRKLDDATGFLTDGTQTLSDAVNEANSSIALQTAVMSDYDKETYRAAQQTGNLTQKIIELPSGKKVTVTVPTSDAEGAIDRVERRLEGIPDNVTSHITIAWSENQLNSVLNNIQAHVSGRRIMVGSTMVQAQAQGGVLEFMAEGGLRGLTPMSPVAQMVPANTWRVVGDRGDVPEAYIPMDGSARSRGILAEAMRRMGVQPMAEGGVVPNVSVAAPAVTVNGFNRADLDYLADRIAQTVLVGSSRVTSQALATASRSAAGSSNTMGRSH